MHKQLNFLAEAPAMPDGFRYQAEFLSETEEHALAERLGTLPFKEFEFQGYLGKRRVVSFGWQYVFDGSGLRKAEDMPDFLLPLRERAAAFAGFAPHDLQHVLLTEYSPGAGIGWHKDRSVFGEVVGISLLAPCTFRLRKAGAAKAGAGRAGAAKAGTWERATLTLEPRSAYLLSGPARTEWEHSIPAVESLRYSVTFRNFRER